MRSVTEGLKSVAWSSARWSAMLHVAAGKAGLRRPHVTDRTVATRLQLVEGGVSCHHWQSEGGQQLYSLETELSTSRLP